MFWPSVIRITATIFLVMATEYFPQSTIIGSHSVFPLNELIDTVHYILDLTVFLIIFFLLEGYHSG